MSLCEGILRAPCLVMSNSLHEIGYWLSWRSVQPFHSRAIDLMRKPADGVDANEDLQSEWCDVSTVTRTAETMVDPFVWRWRSQYPPPESWGWKGMWLSEEEREKVLTDTLVGFLATVAYK